VTRADQCLPVPADLDPVEVAGLVLTQVGYNGGSRPPVEQGWHVVVIGDGLVGQWAAQTFRARGARVLLAGHHPRRLEIAAAVSADAVVDTRQRPLAEAVAEHFAGRVDCVDESVGLMANVELAASVLRPDGHLVLNGYHPEGEHLLNVQLLHDREITCWGMAGWTRARLETTLGWVQQERLRVRPLVTHEFEGREADRAYRLMWDRTEDFLGILLRW
jgi:threonine dehydrogenase-like Zn-dependent dehydrogenase